MLRPTGVFHRLPALAILVPILAIAAASGAAAQDKGLHSLRFGVSPLGGYIFTTGTDFTGGFRQVSALYSYDLGRANSWGTDFLVGAYFDFKGYLYQSSGGYQASSNPFVAIWGLPNFSLGVCAGWRLLSLGELDLSSWWGLEYSHYFETERTSYPGFGATIRLSLGIPLGGDLSLGIGGALNVSTHSGGPHVEDPMTTVDPFRLIEFYPTVSIAKSW